MIEILKVNINTSRFMGTPSCLVMLARSFNLTILFLGRLRLLRSKLPWNSVGSLTDSPNMTIAVYHGHKATIQHNNMFPSFYKERQFC